MADGPSAVLVVDDDVDIRETLMLLLELHGYPAVIARDGAEALAKLRGGLRAGLILLDLMMPGMNGQEFQQEQQRDPQLAQIPLVIITGAGPEVLKEASFAEVLQKPISLATLIATARRFCGEPPAKLPD